MPRRIGPGGSSSAAERDPQQTQTATVQVEPKPQPEQARAPSGPAPGEARIAELEARVAQLEHDNGELVTSLRRMVELVQPVERAAAVADQVPVPDHFGLFLLRDKPAQLVIGDCRKLRDFLERERGKSPVASHPWAGQTP